MTFATLKVHSETGNNDSSLCLLQRLHLHTSAIHLRIKYTVNFDRWISTFLGPILYYALTFRVASMHGLPHWENPVVTRHFGTGLTKKVSAQRMWIYKYPWSTQNLHMEELFVLRVPWVFQPSCHLYHEHLQKTVSCRSIPHLSACSWRKPLVSFTKQAYLKAVGFYHFMFRNDLKIKKGISLAEKVLLRLQVFAELQILAQ